MARNPIDLSDIFGDLLDGTQEKMRVWPAILGNGNGTVVVPNMVKRVYVRMPDGHAAIVFSDDRVPLTNDLNVIVGYDYINPKLFQVLGVRQTYVNNESSGYSTIGHHHETHEYLADHGGQDVVYADARQLMPDRLSVISGLKVGIYNSPLYTTNGWKSAAIWSIDLTSHVPTSGARYVLVSQALDGTLVATDGATVAMRTYLQWSNIPTPPANTRPVGAVVLERGQTAITETRDRNDIIDLRFPTFRAWPMLGTGTPLPLSATPTSGSGLEAAPWNHVHAHGNLTSGSAHAIATSASAGFMPALSGANTQYLNGLGTWTSPSGGGGGGAPLSPNNPLALGVAAPGTSASGAHGDHVHPTTGLVLPARAVATTAPLSGGGDLSADRTLAISPATSASAGSMSAADKAKLDGILPGGVISATSITETPAGGPTVYTPTVAYIGGSTIVFRNGIQQQPVTDYTETGGYTTITLAVPTVAGDTIVMSYEKAGSLLTRTAVQVIPGVLVTGTGGTRVFNLNGLTLNIVKVHVAVSIAPTGAAIIVDVHKNDYTIFTDQAHRPQIAAGAYSGVSTLIDTALFTDGSYLTVDIDQVGSTVAGSNLTVSVVCQ